MSAPIQFHKGGKLLDKKKEIKIWIHISQNGDNIGWSFVYQDDIGSLVQKKPPSRNSSSREADIIELSGKYSDCPLPEAYFRLLKECLTWFQSYTQYKLVVYTDNIYFKNCIMEWATNWAKKGFTFDDRTHSNIKRPHYDILKTVHTMKSTINYEVVYWIPKIENNGENPAGLHLYIENLKDPWTVAQLASKKAVE
jgi:hypothetical protein